MKLMYDAKCSVCRGLAQKIHLLSDKRIDIHALSSPEAQEILSHHYPNGWEHDFYVVSHGKCHKGARALPRLAGALGARNTLGILAEFGYRRLAPRSCADGNGVERSKRNLLKAAAVSPVLLGFSKLAAADPFATSKDGFEVDIAEVEDLGGGAFRARAYPCPSCVGAPKQLAGVAKGTEAHLIEDRMLREGPLGAAGAQATFKIKGFRFEKVIPRNGTLDREIRDGYSSLLDQPRFGIALNFGRSSTVTSLAGMIQHDLPLPVLDWVVFKTPAADAAAHFAAYAEGLRALAALHSDRGRPPLAQLYRQIAESLTVIGSPFTDAIGEPLVTNTNELLVTSMPEAMRFARLPKELSATQEAVAGCDCSCDCNLCCGCGCSLGICLTEIPCFCDCCLACGCGCGCCVF